jgi:DNA-directed RNA polymerase subunit RPC12/RpoP
VCADCGRKFTDERLEAVDFRNWQNPESHPPLCEDCRSRAVAVEQQAEADERDRQGQECLCQEQEAAQSAQKADGWLSRFCT